jgi:hypothetical protein
LYLTAYSRCREDVKLFRFLLLLYRLKRLAIAFNTALTMTVQENPIGAAIKVPVITIQPDKVEQQCVELYFLLTSRQKEGDVNVYGTLVSQ